MGFRSAGGFAVGVWTRAVVIGALGFGAVLALAHHLYATALVLAALAGVLGLDLARGAAAADRMLAQFVDGLMAEGDERPTTTPGLRHLSAAIERALDRLGQTRAQRQQRIDFAEALADNITAALLVVDPAGMVVLSNRAALRLLGEAAGPLSHIAALGPGAGQRLSTLPPGARDIVQLADNRSVLASTAGFTAPGRPPLRLIALQTLSAELDVVMLKAWQDLVKVLAHEMMNSLTPICSLSDSIAQRLRDDPSEGDLSDVAEAAAVIARRSAGLMDFVDRYRRFSDLPPLARSPVSMRAFIAGLDQLMSPMMRAAGVDYASATAPADLTIDADPALLEQAMINLLKNALDAVKGREGAMVRLSCRREDDQLILTVEDNGPGLPGGDAEGAFVPFFTTKAGGSGVGLTLARQIALAHDGVIDHSPRAPTGAIFRLRLPMRALESP